MSPPTIPFPQILLISCILSLTSMPNTIVARSSLIEFACLDFQSTFVKQLCLRILPTIPTIVAATDLVNLSLAIIDAGVSNATATLRHIEAVKPAVEGCKHAYEEVVGRFTEAGKLVRESKFSDSIDELMSASTDYVKECESAMAKGNVTDGIILGGNQLVPVFGLSAKRVVGEIVSRSAPAPPPPPPRRRS